MRWHVLTDDYPPLSGGVATVSQGLVRGLRAHGDEVHVYARARSGLSDNARGVPGRSFGRFGGLYLGLAAWPSLRPGDEVLATTWKAATGLLRLGLRGSELTVLVHGSDITRPASSRREAVLAMAARRLAMSRFLAELVPGGAEVLPAPLDHTEARAGRAVAESGRKNWLVVARLTPLKGVDRVVRLAAVAGATLHVVGDGPERASLERLARHLGASERVTFVGDLRRAQVPQFYRAAGTAFLLPRSDEDGSGAEGLGLSLIEAASYGLAVVGCATGGVPEATGEGLVLADPDDVDGSLRTFDAWWTPERGEAAARWAQAHHSVHAALRVLRRT